MISKPSIFSSLAAAPLSTFAQPRIVLGLIALSLCGGFSALALPQLMPRALNLLWGPLPRYELQLQGGDLSLRCNPRAVQALADSAPRAEPPAGPLPDCGRAPAGSLPASALTLRPPRLPERPAPLAAVRLDAPLSILLRPAQKTAGPVFVHAFVSRAGSTVGWPTIWDSTADGTLQLRGIVRDMLDLTAPELGRYELTFFIQRSPLPLSYSTALASAARDPAATQLLRGELTVLAPVTP